MSKISIVIPCYNSEGTLEDVVLEIKNIFNENSLFSFQIILVDDNSSDRTYSIIKKLAKETDIVGMSLSKNFGQHSALMAGFRKATGDIVVCMDDDGQTPAGEIFKLIHGLDETTDVVYANYKTKKHSLLRNIGSKINDHMAEKLLGKPKGIYVSSYFAAKKYVVDEMIKYKNPYPYVIGLVLRVTNKVINIDVDHRERLTGKSGYTFRKLFGLWVNGFTSFSIKPLRLSVAIGTGVAVTGFMYALYIIIDKIFHPSIVVGWSSLISIIMIMNGILMIMLGLVGEYIGRIFISLNNSPQYVIKEEVSNDK